MKPKNETYLEGPTRSLVEWTPTLLRSARLTSDSGSLRLAADLCDELLTDERIAATWARGCAGCWVCRSFSITKTMTLKRTPKPKRSSKTGGPCSPKPSWPSCSPGDFS